MSNTQSKPINTLNEQMNTLVESQAQEIEELREQLKTMAECSDAGMLVNVDGDCIHNLNKLKKENKKLKEELLIAKDPKCECCNEHIWANKNNMYMWERDKAEFGEIQRATWCRDCSEDGRGVMEDHGFKCDEFED